MGREWRLPFWAHALEFWHCMDFSRFSSVLGNKTGASSCQRKVGICPSALITAIARGCCSSFCQCWIWPWSKMCLCNTSWSQITGSFCLFYFALYLESIFEVTTCTQQEPWNFRVISPEWNPHTFGLKVYSYTCSSLCFFYPSCWEWKRSLAGGFDGEKDTKPAPDKRNDLVVLVRSVRVDVLLTNPKRGWNSLLSRGWARRAFATKKGWVEPEVICRPCCQRVVDSYGMVLLRIIGGGSPGPGWLSSPQAVQDMHSLKPCRSSMDLSWRCWIRQQSSHLGFHYSSINICRSPLG